MSKWYNDDGLLIKFGVTEAEDTAGGEYGDFESGSIHEVQFELSPETLDEVGVIYLSETLRLPKNFYLKSAEIFTETAFAGASFTVDLGLYKSDRTVEDADGIDGAVATAALTAGSTITCDGALVNTRVSTAGGPFYVTATVAGEVPTAGKAWLRVYYYLTNE